MFYKTLFSQQFFSQLLSSLGKRAGVFLTVLYLFTKFLYVANILSQFLILNAFLGPQYTYWGFGILKDIWNGREWSESGHFPRVTMCDFNVRVLGNINRWVIYIERFIYFFHLFIDCTVCFDD